MEATAHGPIAWLLTFSFWYLARLVSLGISVIYYVMAPMDTPLSRRILVSAHGAAMSILYVGAMTVALLGASRPTYGTPFLVFMAIPVLFAILAMRFYQGNRMIHLLQVVNVLCLAWTGFMGRMAVTGKWL